MIWTILTANPITRALAKVAALVLAVLTFGAWNRRSGAKAQKAKQDAANAKAHTETVERVLDETASHDPVADIRRRMRDRAR